jgi:hypothetical protein
VKLHSIKLAALILLTCRTFVGGICFGQDLIPRAYVITPEHANAVIITYSFFDGSILFDPTLPITNATGKLSVPSISYYHTFSVWGRSANIAATLPYAIGNFQGNVMGTQREVYRSGLMDSIFRFSVNLKGGPAMTPKEFASWQQKTILGASLKVIAPTGQYDPTVLINPGTNRWALKPELGLSRRIGSWILDAYSGVWFFTANPEFFSHNQYSPGVNTLSQSPIGAFETHLSHNFKPRLWASFDWNYWYGGKRSVNGVESPGSLQANSRFGATASIPITRGQSIKLSYSYGDIVRVGGNYHNIAVAWQYGWIGKPN